MQWIPLISASSASCWLRLGRNLYEKVFLVDRVQHRACRLLDDLVFECGNCERALLTISLRYVMSPRRQSPICSPMDPDVQVLDLAIEVCLVVLPCQPIHTRCGISLEGEECHPE